MNSTEIETSSTIYAMNKLNQVAKLHKPSVRKIEGMKVGDVIRQGDIYLEMLDKLPIVGDLTRNAQLAIGQTQGSRHIINPVPVDMKLYSPADGSNVLTGPVIDSPVSWTLTHPEHGHFVMEPGIYQTSYQRDWAKEHAEELRRVAD